MQKPPLSDDKFLTPLWSEWFDRLFKVTLAVDTSGTTANRPVKDLFVGRYYFDTTLNKPIWIKTYTAGAAVWVDATGGVV